MEKEVYENGIKLYRYTLRKGLTAQYNNELFHLNSRPLSVIQPATHRRPPTMHHDTTCPPFQRRTGKEKSWPPIFTPGTLKHAGANFQRDDLGVARVGSKRPKGGHCEARLSMEATNHSRFSGGRVNGTIKKCPTNRNKSY